MMILCNTVYLGRRVLPVMPEGSPNNLRPAVLQKPTSDPNSSTLSQSN